MVMRRVTVSSNFSKSRMKFLVDLLIGQVPFKCTFGLIESCNQLQSPKEVDITTFKILDKTKFFLPSTTHTSECCCLHCGPNIIFHLPDCERVANGMRNSERMVPQSTILPNLKRV